MGTLLKIALFSILSFSLQSCAPTEFPTDSDKGSKTGPEIFTRPESVPGIHAYANTYDVAQDESQTITLYSNAEGDFSYVLIELPKHGILQDNGQPINSLPYSLTGNVVTYIPVQNYVGPDLFTFNILKNNTEWGIKAPIYLSVVEPFYHHTIPGNFVFEIPAIDESRWQDPVPYPPQQTITKEDYLKYIEDHYYGLSGRVDYRAYAQSIAGDKEKGNQENWAYIEAFLYRVYMDSDPARAKEHLALAMKLLNGNYLYYKDGPGKDKKTMWDLNIPIKTYLLIKDSPLLTEADHNFIKEYLLTIDKKVIPHEYGAFNRPLGMALGLMAMTKLYPSDPRHQERLDYVNTIWNEWLEKRDMVEDADTYNCLALSFLFDWLNISGQENLYDDSGVMALSDRLFSQISPFGVIANHGQGNGVNAAPGMWIALLEKWASVRNDGQYKWLAHRMFEWTTAREDDMWQWGNINSWMARDLIDAYLAADDFIPEQLPQMESKMTSTKAWKPMNRKQRDETGYVGINLDESIHDKLILSSGNDEQDTFAVVQLSQVKGHGHCDIASFDMLAHGGSLLLGNPAYNINNFRFHNMFQLQTPTDHRCLRGLDYDYPLKDMRSHVLKFEDNDLVTYAEIEVDDYLAKPARLIRRIFFMKNKFLWVHDTLTAKGDVAPASIGPAWNTGTIYGAKGDNWVNTALNTIPLPYLKGWKGPKSGLKYMMQWKNHPQDLLIIFPSLNVRPTIDYVGRDKTRFVLDQDDLQNSMRYRIWDKRELDLQANDKFHFNSLLVPHAPNPDNQELVNRFELIVDEADRSVLKYVESEDREFWIGFGTGAPTQIGPIETNAKFFIAETINGNLAQEYITDGTYLNVNDEYCGDNTVQESLGEDCDVGNSITEVCPYGASSCFVCSAACKVVPGETSYCGDGKVDSGNYEQCDDGNTQSGDACSASCQIESGFACRGEPSTCGPPTCITPPPGLIGWWSGDGHADDLLGKNDGILYGDATFVPGVVGQAFSFDGDGDYIDVGDPADESLDLGMKDFTISFWARIYDDGYILTKGCPTCTGGLGFSVDIANEGKHIIFRIDGEPDGDTTMYMKGFPIDTDLAQWHHYVVEVDRDNILRIYLDGELLHYSSLITEQSGSIDNDSPFMIGSSTTPASALNSLIDELAIWDRALSYKEIHEIYNAGSLGMCK